MKKIIYDIGANNGDDLSYYLLKADLVIAVEANPELCDRIKQRFKTEIENEGRLIVENCVVTTEEKNADVEFYIHKIHHVLSQYVKPDTEALNDFEKTTLPSKSITKLIRQHGEPYYIKIDVEHYDTQLLQSLLDNKIFPPFISAESHDIHVFALLLQMGYHSFKLVDGESVYKLYKNHPIISGDKKIMHSFPRHSAGPFGNDIQGEWMTENNFFRYLAFQGLGWKDIHASRIEPANPKETISLKDHLIQTLAKKTQDTFTKIKRKFKKIITSISP